MAIRSRCQAFPPGWIVRVNLVVVAPARHQGKVIPVAQASFLIGRDPACHLKVGSALVSKKHCGILTRGNKVFVRDLDSTNATYLNGQMTTGELEILDGDRLKVGPLEFVVHVELPVPTTKDKDTVDESIAVAELLGMSETGTPADGVPSGSTILEKLPARPLKPPTPER